MSKKNGSKNGLSNPSLLAPIDTDDKKMLRVVIETPRGSRNKFAFDSKERIFELKKVLPSGMMFPYSFGFIPSTEGEDGDPLDVLVLMDEPVFPGCILSCRPIGVIEGEQYDGKETERNDRILAVEQQSHEWAHIKTVKDLGNKFCKELEQFFEDYHKLDKERFRVLDVRGPSAAWKLLKNGKK
jgi:inorganic pyrophosphatase